MGDPIVITCEHGGITVPKSLKNLFREKDDLLQSHRGWDPGALVLAKKIAADLKCEIFWEEVSRLVIEQNRSLKSRELFSEITRNLTDQQKASLLKEIYHPYHSAIEAKIRSIIQKKQNAYHFSIHSFTPALNGVIRNVDIGLLYDPQSELEKMISKKLENTIRDKMSKIRIRRNYPYKGTSDGLTRSLRGLFKKENYCGIEIEVNQRHYFERDDCWKMLRGELGGVIRGAVTGGNLLT